MARKHSEYVELYTHMNDKVIEAGHLYLKTTILVNGGAAVAVLGFVASIAKADEQYTKLVIEVSNALLYFAVGVAAGLFAIALTYFTNYAVLAGLHHEGGKWEGPLAGLKRTIHFGTLAVACSSLTLFVMGADAVRQAIITGLT